MRLSDSQKESDLSNENVLNRNIESIINEDIHKCDLCKEETQKNLTEDTFLFLLLNINMV